MTRRLLVLLALVAAVAATALLVVLRGDDAPVAVDPAPSATPSATPTAEASRQPPRTELACRAGSPFVPTSIAVDGVTTGSPVLAVPRDAAGVVGVPPLTDAGKASFAWDEPGTRPGSPEGTVLLDAHTWPDGSALGNRLLDGLDEGGTLLVRGGSTRCLRYTVVRRTEVTADTRLPEIYASDGPAQLVVVVCSGTRLGPGDWSHRTLWFAEPA